MHDHTIERENDRSDWYLQWNDKRFVLTNPGRMRLLDISTSEAHRHIDRQLLLRKGVPCLTTRKGVMKFKPDARLVKELKELLLAGLRNDKQYYSEQRSRPVTMFIIGLATAVVSAVTFLLTLSYLMMPAEVPAPAVATSPGLLAFAIAALALIGALVGIYVAWHAWPMLRDVVKIGFERKQ